MASGADFFLEKTLGEDFLQSLEKFELWKPGTKTVVDHEEIRTALKIVPRTLMSFLIGHLSSMKIGETKEIDIPLKHGQPKMEVTKHESDVYTGHITDDNKKVAEFKNRSIPGVGLVVMTAFELYDVEDLQKEPEHRAPQDILDQVQKMIDDRMALHDLIGRVVDKKMSERDAVQQLILAKISDSMHDKPKELISQENLKRLSEKKEDLKAENIKLKKKLALNEFLEERKKKLEKNEYHVHLTKNHNVSCPDCGQEIFKSMAYSGCICMGENMGSKIYITKSEGGVKVRFGKDWDPENIEMLLEVLRGKRG